MERIPLTLVGLKLYDKHIKAYERKIHSVTDERDLAIIKDCFKSGLDSKEIAKKYRTRECTVNEKAENFWRFACDKEVATYSLRKYLNFNSADEDRVIELLNPPTKVLDVLYSVHSLDDLAVLSETELASIKDVDQDVINWVKTTLESKGLSLSTRDIIKTPEVLTTETKISDLPIDPLDKVYINSFATYLLNYDIDKSKSFMSRYSMVHKKIETLGDLYYIDIDDLDISRRTKYSLKWFMSKAKIDRTQFSRLVRRHCLLHTADSILRADKVSCYNSNIIKLSELDAILKEYNIDINSLETTYVLCDFNSKENIPSQYVPSALVEGECFILSVYVTSSAITIYLITKDQIKRMYKPEYLTFAELYDKYIDRYAEYISKNKTCKRDLKILKIAIKEMTPNTIVAQNLGVSSSIVSRVVTKFLAWAGMKERIELVKENNQD